MSIIAREYILGISIILYTALILVFDYYTIYLIILCLAAHIILNLSKHNLSGSANNFYFLILDTIYGVFSLSLYASNLSKYNILIFGLLIILHSIVFLRYIMSGNIHHHNTLHVMIWSLINIPFIINLFFNMTYLQPGTKGYEKLLNLDVINWIALCLTFIFVLAIIIGRNYMISAVEIVSFITITLISIGNAAYAEGMSLKVLISPVYAVNTFMYCYIVRKYNISNKLDEYEEVDSENSVKAGEIISVSNYDSINYQSQL